MKPFLRPLLSICATLTLTACGALGPDDQENDPARLAELRVDFVLERVMEYGETTSTELQTAICRWERDVVLLDQAELNRASDAFDNWRREVEIYPYMESYQIRRVVESTQEGDPEGTFYFRVQLDENLWWLRVPPKARMTWHFGSV